jgi:protein-disulfide isomerase
MLADSADVPDLDEFEECVLRGLHVKRIREQYQEGIALGISSTPTMLINGRMLIGSVPLQRLDSLIAAEFRGRSQ